MVHLKKKNQKKKKNLPLSPALHHGHFCFVYAIVLMSVLMHLLYLVRG